MIDSISSHSIRQSSERFGAPFATVATVATVATLVLVTLASSSAIAGVQNETAKPTPVEPPTSMPSLDPVAESKALEQRIPDGTRINLSTLTITEPVDGSKLPEAGPALLEWLRARRAELPKPEDFSKLRGEDLFAAHRLADQLCVGCWKFLDAQVGSDMERAGVLHEAIQLLNWNRNRFRSSEIDRMKAANIQPTLAKLREALWPLFRPMESNLLTALRDEIPGDLRAKLLYELATTYVGVLETLARGEQVLRDGFTTYARDLYVLCAAIPGVDDETARRATYQAAEMSDRLLDRAACIRHARSLMKNWPTAREAGPAFLMVHRSYFRGGRLQECLGWWQSNEALLQDAAEGKALPKYFDPAQRSPIESALPLWKSIRNQRNFWIGLSLFASGRMDEAIAALGDFLVEVNALTELNELDSHSQVWANHVATPLLQSMKEFHGRPENVALFDLKDGWTVPPIAEDNALYLVLNCTPKRAKARNAPIFPVLEALRLKYQDRGLRVVWLFGQPDPRLDVIENHALVEEWAETLGATEWARGFVDKDMTPLYAEANMSYSQVALFVVDPNRGSVWQLDDPLDWHAGLIEAVVVRELGNLTPKSD